MEPNELEAPTATAPAMTEALPTEAPIPDLDPGYDDAKITDDRSIYEALPTIGGRFIFVAPALGIIIEELADDEKGGAQSRLFVNGAPIPLAMSANLVADRIRRKAGDIDQDKWDALVLAIRSAIERSAPR